MNRRKFLEGLIAAGLAATVDTERLLWTPKLVSIPRPTGLMFRNDAFNMGEIVLPHPITIRYLRDFDVVDRQYMYTRVEHRTNGTIYLPVKNKEMIDLIENAIWRKTP